ncbi:MAG: DUF3810 domain-containing protein [Candidatus Eremiobacteraeota bacterium]|nr:DUF3810 domain-containing protein [Candidatus Eremiobacteraeota bacterium]
MRNFLSYGMRAAAIAIGIVAVLVHPPVSWVEDRYVNGVYPKWEHAIFPVSNALPWSLGDIVGLLGIALLVTRIIFYARRPHMPLLRKCACVLLDAAAIAAVYALWFEAAWGWNYDRAPIEARTAYDGSRVSAHAVDALRRTAIERMNALAPAAHDRSGDPLGIASLRESWLPVVRAGGDRWTPLVGDPKMTIADPFMAMNGTSGFLNPLTLNVQLASDLLWFERPFSLAHEWSHVAAYAREDEANYLAILTCRRSPDPVAQYSGWLELFLYLPPLPRYDRSTFSSLVWQDFGALSERNKRRVNISFARFSWKTYNVYLKSNRIAAGVQNYNEVTRLVLGIALDKEGLPLER